MPVYEYRCPVCTQVFEKLASFSQSDRTAECPSCGERAGKILSTFAAIGASAGAVSAAGGAPAAGAGGGCCGGGCGGR